MISYNLAKRLKDAGFTQMGYGRVIPNASILHMRSQAEARHKNDYLYVPTLSELIEACGEGFSELSRRMVMNTFHVFGGDYIVETSKWQFEILDCATPEEAVANLWLSLHEKPLDT